MPTTNPTLAEAALRKNLEDFCVANIIPLRPKDADKIVSFITRHIQPLLDEKDREIERLKICDDCAGIKSAWDNLCVSKAKHNNCWACKLRKQRDEVVNQNTAQQNALELAKGFTEYVMELRKQQVQTFDELDHQDAMGRAVLTDIEAVLTKENPLPKPASSS
jgi:hypothetical protein